MIDVCVDYEHHGTNQVFQDEGLLIQTLSVTTLEKCKEACTEHQGCNSLSYCSDVSPMQCNLKTKIYHQRFSVFKQDPSCTTHYKICSE